jgi:Eukaryotic-type carbonic anhydrase
LPPEKWSEKYPECGGKRQSPILLSAQTTSECKTDSSSWYFVSGGCTLGNAKAKGRPSNWVCAAFHHLHLLAASSRLLASFAAAARCSCVALTVLIIVICLRTLLLCLLPHSLSLTFHQGEVAFEGCKPQLKVRNHACAGSAHTMPFTHYKMYFCLSMHMSLCYLLCCCITHNVYRLATRPTTCCRSTSTLQLSTS